MEKNSRRLGLGPPIVLAWCAILCVPALFAQAPSERGDYRSLARDIFTALGEVKSTDSGVGSTPAAEAVARRLRAAGFAESDIQVIGPVPPKKNVVVLPGMETGMGESRILRAAEIPSYGVSGLIVEQGDGRVHGKDERARGSDFYAGVEFYDPFMKALVR